MTENETNPVVTVMAAIAVDVAPEHAERADNIIRALIEHGTLRDGLAEAFGEVDFEWDLDSIYTIDDADEAAMITERAFGSGKSHQVLVTLKDGQQVFVRTNDPNVQVQTRSRLSGTWSLPLAKSDGPHVSNTFYIGEW